MSARRGRVMFVLGAVVFGGIVFLLSSGYLIERGQPKWLAAAVGGLAFPVGPLVWHLVGERRRRARGALAKRPPSASLAASDRYVLRALVVAAVVLAPMFAIDRFGVVRAAWQQRAWFVPEPDPADGHALRSPLLAHVPGDAEAALLVIGEGFRGLDERLPPGVFAYGDHQLLAIVPHAASDPEPASAQIARFNQLRQNLPMLGLDPVVKVSESDGVAVMAGERWKARLGQPGGPSPALARELDRAPPGASVVAGFAPAAPVSGVRRAAGWITFDEGAGGQGGALKAVIDLRIEAVSAAEAESLLAEARLIWSAGRGKLPASCRDALDPLASALTVDRSGERIALRLVLPTDKLGDLAPCAPGAALP